MPQRSSDDSNGLLGINERISLLERESKDSDRRLEKLEERNEDLTRISLTMEYLAEENKEQNKRMAEVVIEQTKQTAKINDTLYNLDKNLTRLNSRQDQLLVDFESQKTKVNAIEEDLKGKDKAWLKRGIDFIVAVLLALVLIKFGLK